MQVKRMSIFYIFHDCEISHFKTDMIAIWYWVVFYPLKGTRKQPCKPSIHVCNFAFKLQESMQYRQMLDARSWKVSVSLKVASIPKRNEAIYIIYRWILLISPHIESSQQCARFFKVW